MLRQFRLAISSAISFFLWFFDYFFGTPFEKSFRNFGIFFKKYIGNSSGNSDSYAFFWGIFGDSSRYRFGHSTGNSFVNSASIIRKGVTTFENISFFRSYSFYSVPPTHDCLKHEHVSGLREYTRKKKRTAALKKSDDYRSTVRLFEMFMFVPEIASIMSLDIDSAILFTGLCLVDFLQEFFQQFLRQFSLKFLR